MPTCDFSGTDNYDMYTQLFRLLRFGTIAYLCDLPAAVQRRKLPYFGHVVRARNLSPKYWKVDMTGREDEADRCEDGQMISKTGQTDQWQSVQGWRSRDRQQ